MDGFKNHKLLQPAYVNKVVDAIVPDTSSYDLVSDVPLVNTDQETITVDEQYAMSGMTQAVSLGAESPTVEYGSRSQFSFRPAFFREKIMLSESDMRVMRKMGTASEVETAEQKITERLSGLRFRLETRLEWSKWQMMMGHLNVTQDNVTIDVDYGIPAEFTPALVGPATWDLATSDPLADMQNWLYQFRDEGTEPKYFEFNMAIEKLLLQNDKIRTLHESQFTGTGSRAAMMNREALGNILSTFGGLPYRVFDKGYMFDMKMKTPILGGVTVTVTLAENDGLAVGDEVVLIHARGQRVAREKATILNVVGRTITFTAAPLESYPEGSRVIIKRRFIPDNRFVIRGELPSNVIGGPNIAEFVSTPSAYGPGGMMNPTPGIFSKVIIDDDGDPPKIQLIEGVYGLPILYFPTGNMVAKVTA